jgi:hypothetical protein
MIRRAHLGTKGGHGGSGVADQSIRLGRLCPPCTSHLVVASSAPAFSRPGWTKREHIFVAPGLLRCARNDGESSTQNLTPSLRGALATKQSSSCLELWIASLSLSSGGVNNAARAGDGFGATVIHARRFNDAPSSLRPYRPGSRCGRSASCPGPHGRGCDNAARSRRCSADSGCASARGNRA